MAHKTKSQPMGNASSSTEMPRVEEEASTPASLVDDEVTTDTASPAAMLDMGPMESGAMLPEQYDVCLTDVVDAVYEAAARELGVQRYGQDLTQTTSAFERRGVIVGVNKRVFVPLPVCTKGETPLNVIFVVDTASPMTFLQEATLRALGVNSSGPEHVVEICGTLFTVYLSRGRFAHVDVLGQDFLTHARATLAIDYPDLSCVLSAK